MKLSDLDPRFLFIEGQDIFRESDSLVEQSKRADGLMFLCPKCFAENGGPVGTHAVICWAPHVPQTFKPIPGRWELHGSGFGDLSLVAGSSSVLLTDGCRWHGFVRNGEIVNA